MLSEYEVLIGYPDKKTIFYKIILHESGKQLLERVISSHIDADYVRVVRLRTFE